MKNLTNIFNLLTVFVRSNYFSGFMKLLWNYLNHRNFSGYKLDFGILKRGSTLESDTSNCTKLISSSHVKTESKKLVLVELEHQQFPKADHSYGISHFLSTCEIFRFLWNHNCFFQFSNHFIFLSLSPSFFSLMPPICSHNSTKNIFDFFIFVIVFVNSFF